MSFSARRGEVHALCGENGAGKSTLMKIIDGIYKADAGEILLDGRPANIQSPLDARRLGIAMIFQECTYVPEMSVAESLFLGNLPVNQFRQVDWRYIYRRTEELLRAEGLFENPRLTDGVHTKLKYLSIADIQMLEIVKAISKNSRVLIMDEPTSSISEKEVDVLLRKVLDLKERGTCVIYISHKMEEIFRIADQITVFRDGKVITSKAASELTIDQVIALMVGRELSSTYPKQHAGTGRRLLTVKHLSRRGVFSDISFHLDAGEIVGFAGLVGAGRTEVVRALSGLDPIDSGTVEIEGKETAVRSVADGIRERHCHVL